MNMIVPETKSLLNWSPDWWYLMVFVYDESLRIITIGVFKNWERNSLKYTKMTFDVAFQAMTHQNSLTYPQARGRTWIFAAAEGWKERHQVQALRCDWWAMPFQVPLACWRCQCEPWKCIIPSCQIVKLCFKCYRSWICLKIWCPKIPLWSISLVNLSFGGNPHFSISEARLSPWHPAGLLGQLVSS